METRAARCCQGQPHDAPGPCLWIDEQRWPWCVRARLTARPVFRVAPRTQTNARSPESHASCGTCQGSWCAPEPLAQNVRAPYLCQDRVGNQARALARTGVPHPRQRDHLRARDQLYKGGAVFKRSGTISPSPQDLRGPGQPCIPFILSHEGLQSRPTNHTHADKQSGRRDHRHGGNALRMFGGMAGGGAPAPTRMRVRSSRGSARPPPDSPTLADRSASLPG